MSDVSADLTTERASRPVVVEPLARRSAQHAWALLVGLALVLGVISGCKNRDKGGFISELTPPKSAPAWEPRFTVAFDDSYTPTSINLQGRAANDVLDQQLFQSRLGHASLVLLVEIEQVWGKGRYQGRQDQFIEVTIDEALLGTLPKDAPDQVMLAVASIDELPGSLKGETMLLFVRWDLQSDPPYHHHLMPADDEVVELITAMVSHAKAEGMLDKQGEQTGKAKRKRTGRKHTSKRKRGKNAPTSAHEVDAPGARTVPSDAEPSPSKPVDEPPPPVGPELDSATGLDELESEPRPE